MRKTNYEQPKLDVIGIVCEQGFSLSGDVVVPDGGENNEGGSDNWA